MGQYHLLVNLDKKHFLDPHKLGAGLKLKEQFGSHPSPLTCLGFLLACSSGRGGGDFFQADDDPNQTHSFQGDFSPDPSELIGLWAGDRVALVGDYAEDGDLAAEHNASEIYEACMDGRYLDISEPCARFLERHLGGKFSGEGWRVWAFSG